MNSRSSKHVILRLYLYMYVVEPILILVHNKKSLAGLTILSLFIALAIYGQLFVSESQVSINKDLQGIGLPPIFVDRKSYLESAARFYLEDKMKSLEPDIQIVVDQLTIFYGVNESRDELQKVLRACTKEYVLGNVPSIASCIEDRLKAELPKDAKEFIVDYLQHRADEILNEYNRIKETILAKYGDKYPLGTDKDGRDLLAVLAKGTAPLLSASLLAGLISTLIGVAMGITAGYLGGWFDKALMWVTDVVLCIPSLPLYLMISYVMLLHKMQFNPLIVACVISITAWAGLARAVRSQILSLKTQPFVEVCRSLGLSTMHIVFRELVPNVAGYVAINFIFSATGAIYAITGLFFLGALPQDPTQWGIQLSYWDQNCGLAAIGNPVCFWWFVWIVGALVLLQEGFILLSYGIDEIFNPRLRAKYFRRLEKIVGKKSVQ